MQRSFAAIACVLVGLVAACGGSGGSPDDAGDPPGTFIAFGTSFASFRTWTSVHSDGPPDDGVFTPDVLGPRTQYINMMPPPGSTEFPIGTIIVEARENSLHNIFAGVKRGGNYNKTGAVNWEWFELLEMPGVSPPVQIKWRGFGPPLGETYGGDAKGGCNACHVKCGADTDYVCSPKLLLTAFSP
jgi:hypothetical protein